MAGAEARAVWQRTVNRCFVQEDAKRAPKFTSSSSSRATTTKQDPESSSRPLSSVLDPLHNQSSFMPLHRNQNFTDLSPHNNTKLWNHHHHHHINEQVKKPTESEKPKSLNSESFQEFIDLMETRESYGFDDASSEKKLNELAFEPSSPWNNEKVGPWWRTTDKDELASLVAQRSSLDYVENCDLPKPQKLKRSIGSSPRRFGSDYSVSNQTIGPSKNRTEENASLDTGLSKSELLEALRRSQTRAREAENMAKEAYAEKEHLVKLLFKQASELFGYKQWLQLLQLEALYLQIKNKKKKIEETPVSSSIPWSKPEGKRRRSNKKGKTPNDKPVYSVGLVLGMSLVGAGLLLGWTVGWMQMLSF